MSNLNYRDVANLRIYFKNRTHKVEKEIVAIERLYEKSKEICYLNSIKSLNEEKMFIEKMINKMDYELKNTIGVML